MQLAMKGVPTSLGALRDRLGVVHTGSEIRIPRLGTLLAVVWSASGAVLGAVALAAALTGRPVADFTREPVAAFRIGPVRVLSVRTSACSRTRACFCGPVARA